MPNIITHTLFADDMLSLLGSTSLDQHKKLFEMGSSGPDFLFFHNTPPAKLMKKSALRQAGSWLHAGRINDFYASALSSCIREKNPEIREDMIAYVCGHLCHWALDSTMHPYIFYRTGNCQNESSWRHHRFESLLDALMLKMKRNETIRTYDISTLVARPDREEARAIARIYVPALEKLYNLEVRPSAIYESLQDWHTMQKLFRDPSGRKIRTLQKAEKLVGADNLFSRFGVPPEPEDNYDLCNLLHTPWYNPCSEEKSTDSVLDLYETATRKAARAITLFLNAAACGLKAKKNSALLPEAEAAESRFLEDLADRNYDMGLVSDENMHLFQITDLSV